MLKLNQIHNIDCLNGLWLLDDESVNCCVTSPPYWGLRDYGHDDQLGLEKTPEEYITRMVEVFHEVKRVLRPDGTLWVNIGDSYNAAGRSGHGTRDGVKQGTNRASANGSDSNRPTAADLKEKDLVGIPWRLAFALRADGWYLRQDIIWAKPNPMPESVTDRCTKSHEYIFLLSKSPKYYYDSEAIKEPAVEANCGRKSQVRGEFNGKRSPAAEDHRNHISDSFRAIRPTRNKRDVWTVTTQPFKGAHFAVFPEALIQPCILAGCPEGGIVLDPFMGSGTTAKVALENRRQFIGFELNAEYCKMANDRIGNLKRQTVLDLIPCKA